MAKYDNKFYADRAKRFIPGGAHTYSKGDDQFPANAPSVITRGKGCQLWDAEDNQFTDFALSLGTVVLGHAYEPVLDAVREELVKGVNFVRPSIIEGELAELICDIVPCAEMVKLAKHGSDVTTASIKLARAYTGKERVIRCSADAFNAVHDWFIGSTVVDRGVPKAVKDLTLQFEYNNIDSLSALFMQYPNEIACVIFEPISFIEPEPGFLQAVKELCEINGAILIFDEVVSGFRFSLGGGQEYCGVTPHLAAFGKAMANGFSVSALAGRRDIMELGGIDGEQERVFLLSTTHGGETHSIAAAIKTINTIKEYNIIDHIWKTGGLIKQGLSKAAEDAGISDLIEVGGYDCKPAFAMLGSDGKSCMTTRTLFLQETIKRGVLMPYIVPSFSHSPQIITNAMEKITEAFAVINKARQEGNIAGYVEGDVVKPVFRKFN
ncbi:glutamate-1-semialdehyde 2,1-aminomutase [Colwellia sp. RSH04]|uniref:glutamate-1-semialdehyde 2,1-aminomutase n=1 Tax=Colwellia sp. RSH04 TaxID=2305464 RepID=UPI000E56797B|nr:glutamate-1-semialdehyde 2,1-aminomutase [Colwellia sp. RSH04]RHW76190.1 glutamate-1-semialdehyde 2,1-aminomutase [Colwellia sp. RSH04]